MYWSNLKSLLLDMQTRNWNVTGCSFNWNKHEYVAILSRAHEDISLHEGATSKITFYKDGNLEESFVCFSTEHWLHISEPVRFYHFFGLQGNQNVPFKDVLISFIKHFDSFVPSSYPQRVSSDINRTILSYVSTNDSSDPNKLYCFSAGHSRRKITGEPGKRSSFNSDKTRRLRPTLFEKLGKYEEISFRYSIDPLKEKEDWEIIRNLEKRSSDSINSIDEQ